MNLLERDNNIFEFLIETLDDLWILSQIIGPEDKLFGTTIRKIKIGGENNYKVVQKLIFVELLIKQVKFENETLRVSGEIQNETEFTPRGANHTLKFGLGDKIKLEKKIVLNYDEKLIKQAIETKKSHNLVVLFDKEDLVVAEFSAFSYKILFEKTGLGSKKYSSEQVNEEEEKYLLIKELLDKDYNNIIFAGPGINKERLQKYIKDKIGIKILTFAYPDVRNQAIPKVIKLISESGILQDSQVAFENKYVGELLLNIDKQEKFAYGEENVVEAINSGSAEVFLISTDLIEKKKDDEKYLEINNLMKLVEQLNGQIVIVNSKNESGRILDGLGGVASILRY